MAANRWPLGEEKDKKRGMNPISFQHQDDARRSVGFNRSSIGDTTLGFIWQYSQKAEVLDEKRLNEEVDKKRQQRRKKDQWSNLLSESDQPVQEENMMEDRVQRRRANQQKSRDLLGQSASTPKGHSSPLARDTTTPTLRKLEGSRSGKLPLPSFRSKALGELEEDESIQDRSLWKSSILTPRVTPRGKIEASMMSATDTTPYKTMATSMLQATTPGKETVDFSNLSVIVEKDPAMSGLGDLFATFGECLTSYSHAAQVFELVTQYEKSCREHIKVLLHFINQVDPTRKRFQRTARMLNILYQECYTWRLIGSLYRDRIQTETADTSMDTVELMGPCASEKRIVQALYEREHSTRQCQIILDWLEKNAEDKLVDLLETEHIQFLSDSVSWEHTLHELKQFSQGSIDSALMANRVTEIDPDAPVRQKRALADLDQMDEDKLLRYTFSFLRAGKLEEAQNICIQYGQSWRAATLDGWRLWHDPNRDAETGEEIQPTEGNPFRDIWKAACWKMSQEKGMSLYEKAIYAALSGNLKELLPACESWDDFMWAYFKVLVDVRVEQELRLYAKTDRDFEGLPPSFWDESQSLTPEKIFAELQAHPDMSIRTQGSEPFRLFQRYLILNEIDDLMEKMHGHINEDNLSSSHLLRFMAHLALFFHTAGVQIKDELFTAIMKKYIEVLIENEQHELIAIYTKLLPPDLQIDVYSEFLGGIQDKTQRETCLELAKSAGLNVKLITHTIVENVRAKDLDQGTGSITTEADKKKIDAIEWLVYESSQRADALKQANAIVRCFLAVKKLDAARQVFQKLPPDSVHVIHQEWQKKVKDSSLNAEDDNAIKEYLCIKAYLDAHEAFNSWFHHFHNSAPNKPKQENVRNFKGQISYEQKLLDFETENDRWKRTLDVHVQNTKEKIYNILLFPLGWMIDEREDISADETRSHQMSLLRQLCIPLMCFLLHSVLHSSNQYKECLQMADIIQSDRYKLYQVFNVDGLQKLLSLLRDTSLCLLNQNSDAFGYD